MGRRKRETDDSHGRVKPLVELEGSEDPDQIQMGDLEIVCGGDSDPLMQETEHLDPMRIVGDELDEGQVRSAYLVACHWDWSRNSMPYSVYKMDVATSFPSRVKRKRLHRVTRLATVAGGMTFTSLRSVHRAWIIGVGGDPGDTVIFDTKTKKVIHGPTLNSTKWCPVLTTVGDKIYALCKTPCWFTDPDFPPWFELDSSSQEARIVSKGGTFKPENISDREPFIPGGSRGNIVGCEAGDCSPQPLGAGLQDFLFIPWVQSICFRPSRVAWKPISLGCVGWHLHITISVTQAHGGIDRMFFVICDINHLEKVI